MAYADFLYYQDFFIGTVITDSSMFRQLSERASDYLDMITFGRLREKFPDKYEIQVKKCCCAIAEAIYLFLQDYLNSDGAGKPKTQETIGAYSVSYANISDTISALLNGNSSGLQDYLYSIAMRYLGRTGLLYRGGD
ncbi:MAG: hypothetical protein K2G88_10025 [Oscillospiraceae bacterium]|nr:hypothetical protein [Oscillospiraceae bacterium]